MAVDPNRKRGRPQKFGRAAELISLTLPADVITWLTTVDEDLGWAIVKLHERATKARKPDLDVAQLVRFPGDRALIQVRAALFSDMPGVSLIPLSDGRAFLALESGRGVADLELVVIDRLESKRVPAAERTALLRLRQLLKQWRQEGVHFESRAIIVARHRTASLSKEPA
jgi:hypothetical protein